jgi:hypothetical protein
MPQCANVEIMNAALAQSAIAQWIARSAIGNHQ